jgi:mannose-1-phosphate guanylyltransferase/mannose-6-phosphate isomerase
MTIVPCLLAGGSGTRLWPLSREAYPKQFLKLLDQERSLLQQAVLRARGLSGTAPPMVICGEQHRFIVADHLSQAEVTDATIILEPEGRNTAPAAAIAALQVLAQHGEEALVFLMASDQIVTDLAAFQAAAQIAAKAAANGRIVVFGIKPTRAETGYGYIRRGRVLDEGVWEVAAFVEKPDATRVREFLASGEYAWNGGMFLYPARLFLAELERLAPDLLAACKAALAGAKRDLGFLRLDSPPFLALRADSIDYAVMEKTECGALVPLDCGWDDLGSWERLHALTADAEGNSHRGDVFSTDCRGTLVHAESRLVAAVGLENAVVVETKDAVLVAARDRCQDVKAIVGMLSAHKRTETVQHTQVLRPWGSYETLASGPRYQVKKLTVKPGHKLSLQMHHHRAEHWVVVAGTAKVTCGEKTYLVSENESTYIPLGTVHRLENPGKVPLELIEVQSGAYLSEDDIVRLEDTYGRIGTHAGSGASAAPSARAQGCRK